MSGNKRYFLDLKENNRGRFLKVRKRSLSVLMISVHVNTVALVHDDVLLINVTTAPHFQVERACKHDVGMSRGGEINQQNVIRHKAECEAALVGTISVSLLLPSICMSHH